MTEEIIIDGVNVAGCEFYFEDNGVIAPDGTPERANLCTSPEKSCENSDSCYCNKDCRYKQLKRLEQENKELKQRLSEIGKNWGEIVELRKQVESQKGLITVGGKQQYEMTMAYDKLKTALEEIRDYLNTLSSIDSDFPNTETYLRIQDKINEVLNDT